MTELRKYLIANLGNQVTLLGNILQAAIEDAYQKGYSDRAKEKATEALIVEYKDSLSGVRYARVDDTYFTATTQVPFAGNEEDAVPFTKWPKDRFEDNPDMIITKVIIKDQVYEINPN